VSLWTAAAVFGSDMARV